MKYEWLENLCDRETSRGSGKGLVDQPYAFRDGLVATDGKVLLWIAGLKGDYPETGRVKSLSTIMDREYLAQGFMDLAALHGLAMLACSVCEDRGGTLCSECDGEGVSECYACGHEEECEDCDGAGITGVCAGCGKTVEQAEEENEEHAVILGRIFKKTTLRAIPGILAGTAKVSVIAGDNDAPIRLSGTLEIEGAEHPYQCIVMPCLGSVTDRMPVVEVKP